MQSIKMSLTRTFSHAISLLIWLLCIHTKCRSSAFFVSPTGSSKDTNHHRILKACLQVDEVVRNTKEDSSEASSDLFTSSRQGFLHQCCSLLVGGGVSLSSRPPVAFAFDGGVGGLGKTKPETGVELFEESSTPIQNSAGAVSAEIKSSGGRPILVEFKAPWPLLPSGALEARDLQNSESAFLQVIPLNNNKDWKNPKIFKELIVDTVLSSKGKFGAYGAPVDIKVKRATTTTDESSDGALFGVTFTTYTPAMRESERQLWIQPKQVYGDTLVLLIVGTTRARFASQEKQFAKIIQSYSAIAAPESNLRRRSAEG